MSLHGGNYIKKQVCKKCGYEEKDFFDPTSSISIACDLPSQPEARNCPKCNTKMQVEDLGFFESLTYIFKLWR